MNDIVYEYITKGVATVASAIVCGYVLNISKGEIGIGWFVLSILIIWG